MKMPFVPCVLKTLGLTLFFFTLFDISSSCAQSFKERFKVNVRRLLNPNIYGTRANLKAKLIATSDGNLLDNQPIYYLKPDPKNGFNYLDYRIYNENEGGNVIIRPLNYASISSDDMSIRPVESEPDSINNARNYLFSVTPADFTVGTKVEKQVHLIAIPLLHPFKLRGRTSLGLGNEELKPTLTTDFTVGYSFGVRLRMGNYLRSNFFTLIPWGFGIGNTKYFNAKDLINKVDAAAVTYRTHGILFTLKKVNLGAFAGKDAMIYSQKDWAYQGKWWFSFGVGYQFK
ncbi:hypothetical protein LX87_04125 [Larkinella arboricola]|uniref:Uncharacterized protein n=1 Tax=Larkinella arboricola TaxID=643671 RepID=A0A327WQP8_LARAB|nr:hypothetical protein [Larkinella arboricola]RAJ94240.1 hypothetical protein LX87_04125 [Larkinella arboricola]